MTVAATSRLAGPFTGTGANATLAFSFKCFDQTELLVNRDGNILTLTTHYSVLLNADQEASPGGSVTILAAANTLNSTVYVRGNTVVMQPISLPAETRWSPKIVEKALDRLSIVAQEQRAMFNVVARRLLTYDAPNLTPGDTALVVITMPGVVLGNAVMATVSVPLQGITLTGYVSANDQVTVSLFNATANTIDLGSATLRVVAVSIG